MLEDSTRVPRGGRDLLCRIARCVSDFVRAKVICIYTLYQYCTYVDGVLNPRQLVLVRDANEPTPIMYTYNRMPTRDVTFVSRYTLMQSSPKSLYTSTGHD